MPNTQYWEERYKGGSDSGYGSYGTQLQKKLDLLQNLDIKTISEYGCGDFNLGRHLLMMYPDAKYTGYDISQYIVERNQALYPYATFTNEPALPKADLVLCVDVLFHIIDDEEVEKVLNNLDKLWTKYLAITAYETPQDNTAPHVKVRKFSPSRFGEPIVRKIVEDDGELYFYLFERKEPPKESLDLSKVSACLITKEKTYPQPIWESVLNAGFGEVFILTNCDSPHRKHELFNKAKHDWIYYQDDDALCPIKELADQAQAGIITQAIKPAHQEAYKDKRLSVGLGWGTFFEKSLLSSLKKYTDVYGEDDLYKRETERILTYLNYPQKRLVLPILDLPSATQPDRLCYQPGHYEAIQLVEERCSKISP